MFVYYHDSQLDVFRNYLDIGCSDIRYGGTMTNNTEIIIMVVDHQKKQRKICEKMIQIIKYASGMLRR